MMGRKFEVGSVQSGKVRGLEGYGGFVGLDEESEGVVEICEVSDGFVKEMKEEL